MSVHDTPESVDYAELYGEHDFGTDPVSNARRTVDLKQCEGCGCHYPQAYGYAESGHTVCTERCHYRAEAARLMRGVKFDHQYCAGCYRLQKIVYDPQRGLRGVTASTIEEIESDIHHEFSDDIPDCAIGEAEYEPHMETGGEKSERGMVLSGGEWDTIDLPAVKHSWICSCGNCDHTDEWHPQDGAEGFTLTKQKLHERGERLIEALIEREKRNKHKVVIDDRAEQAFFDRLHTLKKRHDLQGDDARIIQWSLASLLALDDRDRRLSEPEP